MGKNKNLYLNQIQEMNKLIPFAMVLLCLFATSQPNGLKVVKKASKVRKASKVKKEGKTSSSLLTSPAPPVNVPATSSKTKDTFPNITPTPEDTEPSAGDIFTLKATPVKPSLNPNAKASSTPTMPPLTVVL